MTGTSLKFDYEKKISPNGRILIIGVDEAGRGCLAGPVVAAAVILSSSFMAGITTEIESALGVE